MITDHPSPLTTTHVGSTPAKGGSDLWYSKGSVPQEAFQRWHSAGAGSCDTPSHQLATHCCVTHAGDLVLHIFPRGCPVEGWRFLFLLPLLCTLSPLLCPLESLWGCTVCTPSFSTLHFLCLSFLTSSTITHHTLSTTEQCSHQRF